MTFSTAIRLLSRGGSGNGKLMSLRKSSDDQSLDGRSKFESQQITLPRQNVLAAHKLLTDLQQLLDEFGPTWYSEELSERIATVLAAFEEEL